ncbi:lasso peptide biosynthesis B2 protein [Alteraurantiacibacter buctensis]|uniref:Lasso peptide biosynthesis B2 protein n=1 Tax=Alteraurantiacibacter buctensis TaxID=1503981 RepID=A0A844YWQ8_9SPHN|nr:lasso peptide biosynthesis B2 protein [Alteraurantiacibacter buctensis]MXO71261.1 lasso peptide biosynthesis B2 protein [Alteraurantiacibacter buctensis]
MKFRTGLLSLVIAQRRHLPLVAEALVAVTLAGLAIRLWSFSRILESMGRAPSAAALSAAERAAVGARIGWAVPAAAKRLPWRATCFPQGLAAQWMLQRRGIAGTFYYGASITGASLDAHVWVMDGERAIVGFREASAMRTLVQVTAGERPAPEGRVA